MTDSKELVSAFGGAGNMPAVVDPRNLMAAAAAVPKSSDKPYLSFKDGEWTYGAEGNECQDGALWAVNPNSFQHGMVEWCNSQVGAELLVPIDTPFTQSDMPPLKFDPEDANQRVSHQLACELKCLSGDDAEQDVFLKMSTRGGTDALSGLMQAIAKQFAADPKHPVAIIELKSSDYMHKKYKRRTYVPIIEIVDWDDMECSSVLGAEAEAEPEAEEAPPKKARTRKPKADPKASAPPASKRRQRRT